MNLWEKKKQKEIVENSHQIGVVNKSKVDAAANQGVLLLILLILVSMYGLREIEPKVGKAKRAALIDAIETTICLKQFAKASDEHWQKDKNKILEFVKLYMVLVFNAVYRHEASEGWRLPKVHLLLHLITDIDRFGSPANVSGGPGEQAHKEIKTCEKNSQELAHI